MNQGKPFYPLLVKESRNTLALGQHRSDSNVATAAYTLIICPVIAYKIFHNLHNPTLMSFALMSFNDKAAHIVDALCPEALPSESRST